MFRCQSNLVPDTGVGWQVLTRETHFSTASVGRRMNWASLRSTTRVEDEAYCLMGLFNVNMPTIYGEGRQAFQRLQHEIMKQSFDTSLFAWGRSLNSGTLNPLEEHEIYKLFNTSSKNHVYLLANSPSSFTKPFGRSLRYSPAATEPIQPYPEWQWKKFPNEPQNSPQRRYGLFGRVELPKFFVMSYGLECRFPIIESDGLTVAVLLCDTHRKYIGLFLHPSNWIIQDPTRKKYHVGYGFRLASGSISFTRLVSLGNDFYDLRLNGKTVTAEWRDIFIADSPPPIKRDVPMNLCYPLHSLLPAPLFRISHWLIGRVTLLGMELWPLDVRSKPADGKPLAVVASFTDVDVREGIRLLLGTCGKSPDSRARWAKAMSRYSANWSDKWDAAHNCQEHHLEAWPGWTKDFGDIEQMIRLSFSRCKLSPQHTFVVHIELEGRVYNAIKDQTNIRFPSREEAGLVQTSIIVSDVPSSFGYSINTYHGLSQMGHVDSPPEGSPPPASVDSTG
ncbi:hypothetical protein BD309DRAFT_1024525 [Dichomitus squalens]|nr:hypothetical protein BD309DRAFT_1024525 [Dichomitus squalens]